MLRTICLRTLWTLLAVLTGWLLCLFTSPSVAKLATSAVLENKLRTNTTSPSSSPTSLPTALPTTTSPTTSPTIKPQRTLVAVLGETRAHRATWANFSEKVLGALDADLALAIGISEDYDYNNPFWTTAKYRFTVPDRGPKGFEQMFDSAVSNVTMEAECVPGFDLMRAYPVNNTSQKPYYGLSSEVPVFFCNGLKTWEQIKKSKLSGCTTAKYAWAMRIPQLYTKSNGDPDRTTCWRGPMPWRAYFNIPDQWLGLIGTRQKGSAGALILFRYLLLTRLRELGLIEKYDRFVITRSDFLWTVPHPAMETMDPGKIWLPYGSFYGGYTDRHVILSRENVEVYLGLLEGLVKRSHEYYWKLLSSKRRNYNLEQMIKFHLTQHGWHGQDKIGFFPYAMFSVREKGGTTSWSKGHWNPKMNLFVKYGQELTNARLYEKIWRVVAEASHTAHSALKNAIFSWTALVPQRAP